MLEKSREVLSQIGDMLSPVTAHASQDDVGGPGQEIEAVIHLNADAADRIMEAAEQISHSMEVEGVPDAVRFAVLNQVTAIFEACGFQDLTGQRIQHALKTLRTIEESLLGRKVAVAKPHDKIDQAYADSVIGKDASQADIDSLFG